MTRATSAERFDIIKYEDLSLENTWVKLGEGSFGNVYRAQYLGLPVAIKEIIPRSDYNVDKYFARECKILKEARHPNIVQYIGLCLAPPSCLGLNFVCNLDTQRQAEILDHKKLSDLTLQNSRILIISEYIPKGNLRSYLQSFSNSNNPQPLTWRLRISFAIDIARAMAYLHERKCLHRDLKLDNCLLTENLRVKLCDFGFARFEAKDPEEVRRLSYCGTDGYMSPEILRGDPFGLSTDVYSLGIIFCELISMKLAGACAEISHEPGFLERVPPRYSMKSSDVRSLIQAQDGGCPRSFIELSLRCTHAEGHLRPTVKEVLHALGSIEQRIINQEHQSLAGCNEIGNSGSIPSVGSLEFAKSNVKMAGKRSFKRMPSFLGQVSIPKTTNTDSLDSKCDEELLIKSPTSLIFGTDSLLIDPRFQDPINHPQVGQALQSFSTSTLKLANTPTSVVHGDHSSNFLKYNLPTIPGCPFPVALPFKAQETNSNSSCISSSESDCSDFALPPAADQSLPCDFNLSQMGTIPTMNSQSDTLSTTNSSFKLAINELDLAYTNDKVKVPAPKYESKLDLKNPFISLEEAGRISSAEQESYERQRTFSQETVTDNIPIAQITSCLDESHSVTLDSEENQSSAQCGVSGRNPSPLSPLTSDSELPKINEPHTEYKPDEITNILPHRFTIVRSNWLTNLLNINHNHLKETSPEVPKSEKICGGCHKSIGSRKSFLRCDDCGEKCHRKCGDNLDLSPCKR